MEETINVKQENPFAAAFKGTLGKGCGCVVLIIIAFVVLAAIVSSGGSNKKPETKNQTEIKQSATPTPQEVTKITAKELADAFDENQVAAEKNWGGKLVQFSAKVSNITDSGVSFYNVASKDFSMAQISCKVKDKQQLLSIKNDQTITVKGMVGKQFMGVIGIEDCEIVK